MYNQSTPVHAHDAIIKLPLFQGMESDLLHGLIASSRAVEFDKGTVFLAQGQAITRFYIIMDGWCGASRGNVSGQEAILQIFQRGDFLPEADGTLQPDHSPLNLQTLTPVHLLMIAPNIVRNALEHSKAFASNMLAASIHRCNELRDHVEQLTLHTAEERVGRFLLQMRSNDNTSESDIILPFDKSLIAAYLGIKPETFSRTLGFFKEQGFVVEGNHLHVPDRKALCEYCDFVTAQSCRMTHTEACPESASKAAGST